MIPERALGASLTGRKTPWLALALYAGQALASAVVVLVTPHASSGFADFRHYFTVGDWLTVRLPLVAALCVTVAAALARERAPRARDGAPSSVVRAVASCVRVLSVGVGAACGSLTVGIVLWLVVLRIEATDRYFPHYLDWPLPSFGYTVIYAASIGIGSLVFALRRDDALRAAYFMLCSGLLTIA
ncbi:MAG TPA: hypothetical protein VJ726_06245, partial [Candidatus Limnocylindria bacterium]|nr:hypothetical protein [Candidatus Limnocylindria bacterium]